MWWNVFKDGTRADNLSQDSFGELLTRSMSESFILNSHKYSLLSTLLTKVFNLCSSFELFYQEIKELKAIFKKKKGHPNTCVHFFIIKNLDKVFIKKKFIKLLKRSLSCPSLYWKKKSFQLVNSIESKLKFSEFQAIFQSPKKPNTFFRDKDTIWKKIPSDMFISIRVELQVI